MEPFISVIIPAYNSESVIKETVESVLKQTYRDFELIIVLDCPTDNTADIVHALAQEDDRIVVCENEKNQGVSFSRSYGVSVARGSYIAFLDSDDLWDPEKLEKQLAFMKKNNAEFSYTASAFMGTSGEEYTYILHAETKTDKKILLRRNLISCSSVIVKKDLIQPIKMPDDSLVEDYYAWWKILEKTGCAWGLDEPLLIYRFCQNSRSSNRVKFGTMLLWTYKALGFGFLSALFCTSRYTIYSVTKRFKIKRSKVSR